MGGHYLCFLVCILSVVSFYNFVIPLSTAYYNNTTHIVSESKAAILKQDYNKS